MPELKTKVNDASVADFLNQIADGQLREDCQIVVDLMQSAAKANPRMWGRGIIGFGEHVIQYAGGREGAWMMIGFAPRKQNIAFYIGSSFPEHDGLLSKLGKHSTGKGCLYIKRLSDVHLPTLRKMVNASVKHKLTASKSAKSVRKPSASAKSKTGAIVKVKPKSKLKSMARKG